MIKIAICDDHAEELSRLSALMEEYRPIQPAEYEYTMFQNGFEIITCLGKGGSFDIYCLDIIMPGFSGIDLGQEIRSFDKNAQILFFSSSPEFALDSYSVKAADYILKPVTKERLFSSLDDALERIIKEQGPAIVAKSKDGIHRILLHKLVFAEAMGRKTIYHLVSGKAVECTAQFSAVCETLLPHPSFIKPHRSFVVNMNYIDTIKRTSIILQTGAATPIAQGKSREIRESYLAYQMSER